VIARKLPFTGEQFFDVFGSYNAALWPAIVVLWTVSALIVALLLSSRRRPSDRVISGLLAVHWAWSAFAYHLAFVTAINPAAWIFAALFLVQAGLLFWWGAAGGRLRFTAWQSAWAPIAWVLVGYSLVYPGITMAQHATLTEVPTFGVPCPTTIFTAGLLLLTTSRSWALSVIPIIWSAIGGSAAFLFGVRADYALPIAGGLLAAWTLQRIQDTRAGSDERGDVDHRAGAPK
jgi:hypothetical protein